MFKTVSREDLTALPDVGVKVATSIQEWFNNLSNQKFLEKLSKAGIRLVVSAAPSGGRLKAKSFVVTGVLSGLTRDEAKATIRKNGGIVSESVSRKTDYVLVCENPGSKYEKAKKLGVTIINEKEFLNLL